MPDNIFVNDLLCFVQNNVNNLGVSTVCRLCQDTYMPDEIHEALVLLSEAAKHVDSSINSDLHEFASCAKSKENVLKKIAEVFENSEVIKQLQFVSTGHNIPRMGIYRDALTIACLRDELHELKQIITEQNKLLSSEIRGLCKQLAALKKKTTEDVLPQADKSVCLNDVVDLDTFSSPASYDEVANTSSSSYQQNISFKEISLAKLPESADENSLPCLANTQITSKRKGGLAKSRSCNATGSFIEKLRVSKQNFALSTFKKRHVCEICGYSGNLTDVTRHKRTHTGEKPFACPLCLTRFTLRGNMVKHLARKHGTCLTKISSERKKQRKNKPFALTHTNSNVNNTATDEAAVSEYVNNMIAKYSEEFALDQNGDNIDQSTLSNDLLPNFSSIKEEFPSDNITSYPVSCIEQINLEETENVVSQNQTNITASATDCVSLPEFITGMVTTYNNLPEHENSMQNEIQTVDTPGRQDIGISMVKDMTTPHHMRKKHSCLICGFTGHFTDVTRHMRKHTGERPFQCTICSARFSLRGNMVKHMTRKHRNYPPQ